MTEYVLVPREPTPEMLAAAGTMNNYDVDAGGRSDDDHIAWWKDMLAAAGINTTNPAGCAHEWHPYVQAINKPRHQIVNIDDSPIAGYENLGRMCSVCGKIEPPAAPVRATGGELRDIARRMKQLAEIGIPVKPSCVLAWADDLAAIAALNPAIAPAGDDGMRIDWRRIEEAARQYVEEYEMVGEDEQGREGVYTPTDKERVVILDAMFGLFSDDDFNAALNAAPQDGAWDSPHMRQTVGELLAAGFTVTIEAAPQDGEADQPAVIINHVPMPRPPADVLKQVAADMEADQPVGDGVSLIAAERQRQVTAEGWTPEHDDAHNDSELASAAACYAHHATLSDIRRNSRNRAFEDGGSPPDDWPWDEHWWKPKDRIRDLVRAGALIAAEIDRLQREAACG